MKYLLRTELGSCNKLCIKTEWRHFSFWIKQFVPKKFELEIRLEKKTNLCEFLYSNPAYEGTILL